VPLPTTVLMVPAAIPASAMQTTSARLKSGWLSGAGRGSRS
jgi:hypothetical protein